MIRSKKNRYLYFSAKERRGTLLLLSLVLLLCSIPFVLPFIFPSQMMHSHEMDRAMEALHAKQFAPEPAKNKNWNYSNEARPYDAPDETRYYCSTKNTSLSGTLFYFDPNTLSEAGWQKLGLTARQIKTLLNYRNKGGRFKQPDDIKKIWGLHPSQAAQLIPYIQIAASIPAQKLSIENNYSPTAGRKPVAVIHPVPINSADTGAWIALPGIGSKLSQRIVSFREKLGGFYNIQQVAETYALPDSTFQKIKPYLQLDGAVKKININMAALDELKKHPYIKYPLANAIVQYRQQHGKFSQITDLKKIMIVDEATYQKLMPYIHTE